MNPLRPKYSLDAKRNFAAAMRANPTDAEAAMWEMLRARQTHHLFRRQISLWGFIVDFYCPSLRIAIEVDGSIHRNADKAATDALKDRVMEERRITLLRFENKDVLDFPQVVLLRIKSVCEERARVKSPFKGLVLGHSSKDSSNRRACVSLQNQPPAASPLIKSTKGLCTTEPDIRALGENRVSAEEYETFLRKLVTVSRKKSDPFYVDNRSSEEKAADLRYRFNEYRARATAAGKIA